MTLPGAEQMARRSLRLTGAPGKGPLKVCLVRVGRTPRAYAPRQGYPPVPNRQALGMSRGLSMAPPPDLAMPAWATWGTIVALGLLSALAATVGHFLRKAP